MDKINQKKGTHSIRINNELWKKVKETNLNVSQYIEESLSLVSNDKSRELLKELCFCNICLEEKDIDSLCGFDINHHVHGNKDYRTAVRVVCCGCLKLILEDKTGELNKNVDKGFLEIIKEHYPHYGYFNSKHIKAFMRAANNNEFIYWEIKKGLIIMPSLEQQEVLLGDGSVYDENECCPRCNSLSTMKKEDYIRMWDDTGKERVSYHHYCPN
ncbi:hypothetical protein HYT57_02020 [Candidatus Woesearchaeota archaeon]|nr:hypothetical protein [Candidatus Woesearchaeota archaeon]